MITRTSVEIDQVTKKIARRKFALPDCIHVLIAAGDVKAIETYIGTIDRELGRGLSSHQTGTTAFVAKLVLPPQSQTVHTFCKLSLNERIYYDW